MAPHVVESWDDPLLDPFRNLKDRELARNGGRFIAEGQNVVQRLLRSKIPTESVLVARRKLEAISPFTPPQTILLTADDAVIEKVIGFEFHSGVLACGIRPESPRIDQVLPSPDQPALIVVCQEITNSENLGALIRTAAAFGADAMLLGERCSDPFFRQSIRVSMGAVFSLPMVRSENLLEDLETLKRAGVQCWATVLSPDAEDLRKVHRPARLAVILGSEAQGLDASTIACCQRRVTIPMQRGIDSLNVTVAEAVVLYQLASRATP